MIGIRIGSGKIEAVDRARTVSLKGGTLDGTNLTVVNARPPPAIVIAPMALPLPGLINYRASNNIREKQADIPPGREIVIKVPRGVRFELAKQPNRRPRVLRIFS